MRLRKQKDLVGGNFIKVPNLVAVRYMQGSSPHPFLSQYKACALTKRY